MKRTDADGATVNNLYTEGDPGLGIPATVVGDSEMNNIQEEIALFIESEGLTLDGGDFTQLQQALNLFFNNGGPGIADFTILNDTSVKTDVTGLLVDKTKTKAAIFQYQLHRDTALPQQVDQVGKLILNLDAIADDFKIRDENNVFDEIDNGINDSGVTFSVTAAGQVQYVSNDLLGGSHAGLLRITGITKFKI